MGGDVEHLRILGEVALQDAHKIRGCIHLVHGHGALDSIEPHGFLEIAVRQVRN